MFMLRIKKKIQILNSNNFFKNEIDPVGNFEEEITRPTLRGPKVLIENTSRITKCDN